LGNGDRREITVSLSRTFVKTTYPTGSENGEISKELLQPGRDVAGPRDKVVVTLPQLSQLRILNKYRRGEWRRRSIDEIISPSIEKQGWKTRINPRRLGIIMPSRISCPFGPVIIASANGAKKGRGQIPPSPIWLHEEISIIVARHNGPNQWRR